MAITAAIPAFLLTDLERVPGDRPVTLLMRHSVRYPIPSIDLTYTIGLTEEGVQLAEGLGRRLGRQFKPGRLVSSPVGRCIDTAAAIARGAGWPETVREDGRLSHPFMAPAYNQVERGRVNGHLPWQVRVMMGLLVAPAGVEQQPGRLDVMVTHDTIVAAVAGSLLRVPVLGPDWPDYLEGMFLWQGEEQVHLLWRGIEGKFTSMLARVE